MILDFKMIINNLLRKLFTKGKSLFFVQNINNLKKTFLSKNPVVSGQRLYVNEIREESFYYLDKDCV